MGWSWIGVDFDGTLAIHPPAGTTDEFGAPIPAMVERVKQWLAEGREVRILTARVNHDPDVSEDQRAMIEEWCLVHIGQILPVTCSKDYGMEVLYDDRAIQVERDTGRIIGDHTRPTSGRCRYQWLRNSKVYRCELRAGHDVVVHQCETLNAPGVMEFQKES